MGKERETRFSLTSSGSPRTQRGSAEVTVPVIGPIPAQLTSDEYNETITFTKPHEIIAFTSIMPEKASAVQN